MSEETNQEKKIRISDLAANLKTSYRMVAECAERADMKIGPPLAFVPMADAMKITEEFEKLGRELAARFGAVPQVASQEQGLALDAGYSKPVKQCIFASLASEVRLGNWIAEVKGRDSGTIIRSEGSLDFNDGIKVTSNPIEIDFIRNTTDPEIIAGRQFRDGQIREFDTVADALAFRREVLAKKSVKVLRSSDESDSNVEMSAETIAGLQDTLTAGEQKID
jgi:hypothetical protein